MTRSSRVLALAALVGACVPACQNNYERFRDRWNQDEVIWKAQIASLKAQAVRGRADFRRIPALSPEAGAAERAGRLQVEAASRGQSQSLVDLEVMLRESRKAFEEALSRGDEQSASLALETIEKRVSTTLSGMTEAVAANTAEIRKAAPP
jgi:hypothetical protein